LILWLARRSSPRSISRYFSVVFTATAFKAAGAARASAAHLTLIPSGHKTGGGKNGIRLVTIVARCAVPRKGATGRTATTRSNGPPGGGRQTGAPSGPPGQFCVIRRQEFFTPGSVFKSQVITGRWISGSTGATFRKDRASALFPRIARVYGLSRVADFRKEKRSEHTSPAIGLDTDWRAW
jgi:hypothetical protein